ncbi:hypothetical protein BE20_09265 [Sorangium cellulosum]|uniref:Secreted protein n=1 Tax=Sorangium cellulosum TaxID=56 RepID=A0A150RQB8_SORCE|nr:hypothetical protein BE18_44380 [Sorangium cellulosum]KYF93464.1 hypothetical protein BE20_09265 [Sorangium cellulosum]
MSHSTSPHSYFTRVALTVACGLFALAPATALAGVDTFPGWNSYTFEGSSASGPVWGAQTAPILHYLTVCAGPYCDYGDATAIGNGTVIGNQLDQIMNGAAVRGDNAYLDPQGQRVYHSMSFELDTMDFFSKNPKAHIAVSPRAFLPYAVGGAMYHGYPAFTVAPTYNNAKVPYAMGSGIMLGNVPCFHQEPSDGRPFYYDGGALQDYQGDLPNAVGIEHFLRPWAPSAVSNKTWCQKKTGVMPAPVFQDQSTYQVNVSVKRSTCNAPQTGTCQWVGYFIQEKQCSGFGCTWVPVARGGGPRYFPDTSGAGAGEAVFGPTPLSGWSALQPGDGSSWFIASIFTKAFTTVDASSRWSFKVRSLWTDTADTAPLWWSACLDTTSPDPYTCGNL